MPPNQGSSRDPTQARLRIVGDLGLDDEGFGLKPIQVHAADEERRRGEDKQRAREADEEVVGAEEAPERGELTGVPWLEGVVPLRHEEVTVSIILELNVAYPGGLDSVKKALFELFSTALPDAYPLKEASKEAGQPTGLRRISARLYQCAISRSQLAELMRVNAEQEAQEDGSAVIFKAWADYSLHAHVDRSARTVKADAARRSYTATGRKIVWAVMDTGIDHLHPHFQNLPLFNEKEWKAAALPPDQQVKGKSPTFGLHRDFTWLVDEGLEETYSPLTDESGHGTHVAGIVAGRCPDTKPPHLATSYATVSSYASPTAERRFEFRSPNVPLRGMAPDCALVSLKVLLHDENGDRTSSAAMIRAIDYIQNEVNVGRGPLQIHGVNISIGTDWFANVYAAGQSPLCQAINDLVSSGVIVVISAGNSGMDTDGRFPTARMGSITEPGHTADAITVGSTHRDSPHSFGITFDSSKGPTMDGRRKPDVVAPGEWIASAATGHVRTRAGLDKADLRKQGRRKDIDLTYAEMSGTSMAAPHVSGVIAAFLSARPEFIGRPREVRQLLCESATDLGREGYAQGNGLVDLMRMLSNS